MDAVPLRPSLVAVMVADPGDTAATSPVPLTVATPLLSLAQLIVRPESTLPLASLSVAVSCTVCPTGALAVAGLTDTVATGTTVTAMLALPLLPSLVAVIVVEPGDTAVTSPVALTVATAALLDVQVTVRPVKELPPASLRIVASCWVLPATTLAVAGLTDTVATGAGTVGTAAVVPLTTFDRLPNTAFTLSVPRYATSSKLYVVPGVRPSTAQVCFAPIAVPMTGVVHVPRVTLGAELPQVSVEPATPRMS